MKKEEKYEDEFEKENFFVRFYRNNKILVWILILVIVAIIGLKLLSDNNSKTKPSKDDVQIVIEPKNITTVSKGNTINLIANINISNASIIWTSSDENILKVSNGSVTGINYGKANVTATYIDNDGKKHTDIKEISVIEGDPNISLNSISFKDGDLYMPRNKEYQLDLILDPSNSVVNDKVFTSSDSSVVTVTNDGLVKSINEGDARISVTVNGKYKTAIDVYVSDKCSNSEILISPTTVSIDSSNRKMKVGSTEVIDYYISPSSVSKSLLTWSSSNKDIVTVDNNGKVVANKEGTATITLSSINGRKDSITIDVYSDIVSVESIELSVDNITMEAGKTEVITPIVMPSNASNKGLSYSTSDANVITVTPNVDGTVAVLSAIKKGNAIITIKSGIIEKKLTVTVTGEGNNSQIDDDDPNLPTTIIVRSNKNNLAKSYDEAKKIPVYGETEVSIKMSIGVGMIKYCINKYGSVSCKPNIELYSDDTVKIPTDDIYVLRIIKYDYTGNEISSTSKNYVDGVLNYYINTKGSNISYTITGAYETSTAATISPINLNGSVVINVTGTDGYLKACATNENTACTPNIKITNRYTFALNQAGTWHIIVNEYDNDNKMVGNSKVYFADVVDTNVIDGSTGQYKVSNLKVYNDNTNGKYLSVDVESDINFSITRFCYTSVNKGATGTCNLDLKSNSVPLHDGKNIIHPQEKNKTYYALFAGTNKKTFNFYLDELNTIFNNSDTKKDVIFEFAFKSSKGFSIPIKIRINMTNRTGNTSTWDSKFIK